MFQAYPSVLTQLQAMGPQLSVGLLTANWMNLASEIELLEKAGIRMLHFDVMDGQIWPKLTAGSPMIAGLRHNLINDVHLLVENPENHVMAFAEAGADIISFAVEYASDIGLVLDRIGVCKNLRHPYRGISRCVSLNPETPVSLIEPFLDQIDGVVLLAVGPKTGKQTFFEAVQSKVTTLRNLKPDLFITIDGGIRKDNASDIADLDIDCIVTGSAVFDGKNPSENLAAMMTGILKKSNHER